ncbi:MAG: hypothetical protein HRT61_22475 [Ekhidna sp.]|nr:hypothetical protein [Ekhidna sp.]
MWFKKRKVKLFHHPLVEELEREAVGIMNIQFFTSELETLERLSEEEQRQSEIEISELLSIFEMQQTDLLNFTCFSYTKESNVSPEEEYPSGEEPSRNERTKENKSLGLSKGFSITYSIYFYFLLHNKLSQLDNYLVKRRIPNSKQFGKRLKQYFENFKHPRSSESYIQYAAGYDKDNVTIDDIDKALTDIHEMDEEHGAFWISVFVGDKEHLVEVNKRARLSILFGEDEEWKYECKDWKEVKSILCYLIQENIEKVREATSK